MFSENTDMREKKDGCLILRGSRAYGNAKTCRLSYMLIILNKMPKRCKVQGY